MSKDFTSGAEPEQLNRLFSIGQEESPSERQDSRTDALDIFMEKPGSRIGRYELLSILGEGGMGVVYLAKQHQPVQRQVAIKIVKPGMDSKRVIVRFEAERQALALLDHPNIAQVYDAGTTEAGRPYFVMEYVKGLPITEHCDHNKLTIEDRLALFLQVCHAINHAHQKGIIHRDIKPSNILISTKDDNAVPKIIDFGVAKAVRQSLTEKTLFTEQGQLVGTPEYMSPEQADTDGDDIDTRSDIYSLGVALYQLLTGILPFDSDTLREGGIDHVRKVICEQEPRTPSTRLSSLGEEAESVAQKRQTDVASLTRRLHRELEWIPLKAVRKDPARRYRSVAEFADDIENYLRGSPLIAGPESLTYRAGKFVRRHRAVALAVASVAVVLVLATLISTISYVLAVRAEQQATAAAQRNRRLSYVSDVSLAHHIYLSGDIARATHLLLLHLPTEDGEEEDLRGFGWYYLWNVCRGQWSVRAVPHQGFVEVAFSPDGRTFATGGSDGMIRIWDRDTLMQKTELSDEPDPHGQYRSLDLLYSPSGEVLAGLSRRRQQDDSGRVVLFDVGSRASWSLAHASPNNVVQIAFKKDGNTLITAERGGRIRFWDVLTGQPIGKPRQLEKDATWRRAAFSSDLRLLAAGGPKGLQGQPGLSQLRERDVQVKIYDLETGVLVSELQTDQSILGKLQFTQDSRYLINPGNPPYASGKLVVWEIATGQEVLSKIADKCFSGVVSISSDQVAVGGLDFISFVNPAKETIVDRWDGVPGVVIDLALSPDGKQLASAGWEGMVRLWDLPRKENPMTVKLNTPTSDLSFSPDGDMLASAHPAGVVVRNAFSFEEVYRLDGQTRPVFSPSEDRLATISIDATIHFWDSRSGQQISPPVSLEGHNMGLRRSGSGQLAFSTNGKLIGYAATGDIVIVLDVATGRIRRQFGIPSTSARRYLAFGANGDGQDLIAIPEGTRSIKLVNLDDGHEQILEGPTGQIWGAYFSPDGLRLVSSGDDIFVWNTNTGELELAIEENISFISQAAFSPDGTSILSRGWKGSLGLWDLKSGREKIRLLEDSKQTIQSMVYSPDGNRIIAGVNRNTLMVWSAPRVDQVEGTAVEIRSP